MAGRKTLAKGGPILETSIHWVILPGSGSGSRLQVVRGRQGEDLEPGKGKARDWSHRVWDPALCFSACSGPSLWLRNGKHYPEGTLSLGWLLQPLKSLWLALRILALWAQGGRKGRFHVFLAGGEMTNERQTETLRCAIQHVLKGLSETACP